MKERTWVVAAIAFIVGFLIIKGVNDNKVLQNNRAEFMSSCQAEAEKYMTNTVIYCTCARQQYEDFYKSTAYTTEVVPAEVIARVRDNCSM